MLHIHQLRPINQMRNITVGAKNIWMHVRKNTTAKGFVKLHKNKGDQNKSCGTFQVQNVIRIFTCTTGFHHAAHMAK